MLWISSSMSSWANYSRIFYASTNLLKVFTTFFGFLSDLYLETLFLNDIHETFNNILKVN